MLLLQDTSVLLSFVVCCLTWQYFTRCGIVIRLPGRTHVITHVVVHLLAPLQSELLVKSSCITTQRYLTATHDRNWWGLGLSVEDARCRICLGFLCNFECSNSLVSGRRAQVMLIGQ